MALSPTSSHPGIPSGGTAGGDLTGTYPSPTFDLTKPHVWAAPIEVDNDAANHVPLTVKAHSATQTADILDVVDKTGRYRLYLDRYGVVKIQASPDADETDTCLEIRDGVFDLLSSINGLGQWFISPNSDIAATGKVIEVSNDLGTVDLLNVLNDGGIATAPAAAATATLSSGTGAQLKTDRDVRSHTPVTFNPTAGAAATCAVAISKDGTNYTALWTETEPAGIAFDGTIHGLNVYVPAGWKLKLTVTNATIGTTTYY